MATPLGRPRGSTPIAGLRLLLPASAVFLIACGEVDRLRIRAWLGGADSQLLLGHHYDHGFGVPQDDAQAVRWYLAAAEQGHSKAPLLLAEKYVMGEGVEKDVVRAHMWFRLAGDKGKGIDSAELQKLEQLMSVEQVAESERQAASWRESH